MPAAAKYRDLHFFARPPALPTSKRNTLSLHKFHEAVHTQKLFPLYADTPAMCPTNRTVFLTIRPHADHNTPIYYPSIASHFAPLLSWQVPHPAAYRSVIAAPPQAEYLVSDCQ